MTHGRPLCLALQPGYHGDFTPRCADTRGHHGQHTTSRTPIGMGRLATPTTWDNTDEETDAA